MMRMRCIHVSSLSIHELYHLEIQLDEKMMLKRERRTERNEWWWRRRGKKKK
jgi:hypothetical protein